MTFFIKRDKIFPLGRKLPVLRARYAYYASEYYATILIATMAKQGSFLQGELIIPPNPLTGPSPIYINLDFLAGIAQVIDTALSNSLYDAASRWKSKMDSTGAEISRINSKLEMWGNLLSNIRNEAYN